MYTYECPLDEFGVQNFHVDIAAVVRPISKCGEKRPVIVRPIGEQLQPPGDASGSTLRNRFTAVCFTAVCFTAVCLGGGPGGGLVEMSATGTQRSPRHISCDSRCQPAAATQADAPTCLFAKSSSPEHFGGSYPMAPTDLSGHRSERITRSSIRRSIRAVAPQIVSPSTLKNQTGNVPSEKFQTSSW